MSKKKRKTKNNSKDSILIHLSALVRNDDGTPGVYYATQFKDIDGKAVDLLIPSAVGQNLSSLKKYLIDRGFPNMNDNKRWKEVQAEIGKTVEGRARLVRTPGYVGHGYLQSNGKTIGCTDDVGPFLDPETDQHGAVLERSASLRQWKDEVAVYAIHSSRLMLALCSSISAYILRWSGVESGGFHFYGVSSTGKSTCLYAAISVFGPRDNLGSWAITGAAVEEYAAAHNDMLITLDEIKVLDEDPIKAAQKASAITYKITLGKGKKRSRTYMSVGQQKALQWVVGVLSTGELSLNDHVAKGGASRMRGEEVRVVDVPADAGKGMGVYESLPKGVASSNDLAKILDGNTKTYYGSAQKKFLSYFVKRLSSDHKGVSDDITLLKNKFLKKHDVDCSIGFKVRFAERFALSYAAGVLAIGCDLLPFTQKQVMNGVSKCYLDALQAMPLTNDEKMAEARGRLEAVLAENNYLDVREGCRGLSKKEVDRSVGFIAKIKGYTVKAVRGLKLNNIMGDDFIKNALLDEYKRDEKILVDSEGKMTRSFSPPGSGLNPKRYYCFIIEPRLRGFGSCNPIVEEFD